MKKIIIGICMTLFIASSAMANETTFYILGNRTVLKVTASEPGQSTVKIVDCQSKKCSDRLGCILATIYEKEKQKLKK